jgi:FkbM family methyltransferase
MMASIFLRAYKNWPRIMFMSTRWEYPSKINGKLRNGGAVWLRNRNQASLDAFQEIGILELKINLEGDVVSFNYDGRRVTLYGGFKDGDIPGIFFLRQYSALDVTGGTVIDVGANIGDSAIFFALSGAKKVVAIEPYPSTYETLVRNIDANGLASLIKPINSAISNSRGHLKLEAEIDSTLSVKAHTSETGMEVESLTLQDILNLPGLEPPCFLKMDCEGCEFEVFGSLDERLIDMFQRMMIEYHSEEIEPILSKLKGYSVSVSGKKKGIIYATKKK